jgi:hypothetical protein
METVTDKFMNKIVKIQSAGDFSSAEELIQKYDITPVEIKTIKNVLSDLPQCVVVEQLKAGTSNVK